MQDEMKRTGRGRTWGDTALVRRSTSWPSLPAREPDASADSVWAVRVQASTMELTNAAEQRPIGTLTHGSEIRGVRFIPASEPRWLVSAGADGSLRIWPLMAQDLVTEACARLRGSLTREALARYVEEVGRASCTVQ